MHSKGILARKTPSKHQSLKGMAAQRGHLPHFTTSEGGASNAGPIGDQAQFGERRPRLWSISPLPASLGIP